MIDRTTSKGYRVLYDETFQPGDLITTYHSGYHRFIRYEYENRGESAPLVFYTKAYDSNGKRIKGKAVERCDAAFCRRASDRIHSELADLEKIKEKLLNILVEEKLNEPRSNTAD